MRAGIAALLAVLAPIPAQAADLTDWNVSPYVVSLDDWSATVGGSVSGAGYWAAQSGGVDRAGLTGAALLTARIDRQLDNGWDLAINASFLPWHDALSGDNYGDRFFEKEYLSLQTQYGRVEIGQQDGAAYRLSTIGPSVDGAVSLDEGTVTFFRNPATGDAFDDIFRLRTGEFATQNFAKISYYSPRLFGVQVAGSYTPYEARDGLPLLSRGYSGPDRALNMFEAAANARQDVGSVSAELYASAATVHDDNRTAGHGDLIDYATGLSVDTDIDEVKLSVGGGYRQSNAYAFDIDESFQHGTTRSFHVGSTATRGPWIVGIEFSDGIAGHELNLPRLHETGFEPSVGYVVNSNLQLTLGFQALRFSRDVGVFYDNRANASMQAAFLHARFHI
jgi:hypothetical protein